MQSQRSRLRDWAFCCADYVLPKHSPLYTEGHCYIAYCKKRIQVKQRHAPVNDRQLLSSCTWFA